MSGARKISAITLHYADGSEPRTYSGDGAFSVIDTQTKQDTGTPASWPWLRFVTASLVIRRD